MSNILVTGGAGFIGSNLTEELLKKEHHVTVLDNFATGKIQNLPPHIQNFPDTFILQVHILHQALRLQKQQVYRYCAHTQRVQSRSYDARPMGRPDHCKA